MVLYTSSTEREGGQNRGNDGKRRGTYLTQTAVLHSATSTCFIPSLSLSLTHTHTRFILSFVVMRHFDPIYTSLNQSILRLTQYHCNLQLVYNIKCYYWVYDPQFMLIIYVKTVVSINDKIINRK